MGNETFDRSQRDNTGGLPVNTIEDHFIRQDTGYNRALAKDALKPYRFSVDEIVAIFEIVSNPTSESFVERATKAAESLRNES